MFASFLISLRETLEAAFVIGIILSLLSKTNYHTFRSFVWRGVIAGISLAIIAAELIDVFMGSLFGRSETIVEGILMFVTVGFLTWMILWVHRQKQTTVKIKQKVAKHVQEAYGFGIFLLAATSVFREGMETVLYLKATSLAGLGGGFLGVILGIFTAVAISFALFTFTLRIKLSIIFNTTSLLLLLFAAGLLAHGVHEFQDVGILPIFTFDPIMNISGVLDNTSLLGSMLRTLFGYTSKPTFLEAVSYGSYILFILWFKRLTDRLMKTNQ